MTPAASLAAVLLNIGPVVEMTVGQPETFWLNMSRPAVTRRIRADVLYDPRRLDLLRVEVPADSPCHASMMDDDEGKATVELTCPDTPYPTTQAVGFVVHPLMPGMTTLTVPTCEVDGRCKGVGRVIEVIP